MNKDLQSTLMEARLLTENNLDDAIKSIQKIKDTFGMVPALQPLKPALDNITSGVLKQMADGSLATYMNNLKKTKGGLDFFKTLFLTPSGKILGQLNLVHNALISVSKASDKIVKALEQKDSVTKNDIKLIENAFKKEALGTWFAKLSSAFKVKPHESLNPESIVEAFLGPLREYEEELDTLPAGQAPDKQNLTNFIDNLKQIKTITGGDLRDGFINSIHAADEKGLGTSTKSAEMPTEKVLNQVFGSSLNSKQIGIISNAIKNAGYKVVKA
jgi:hypothetical protein